MSKTKEDTALAKLPSSQMPAGLADDLEQYAGAGVSDRQEDFLLPFLMIAQANSPQLKKQQADKYIPGLEAGDIFNTATRQVWKSAEGVLVLQAHFQKAMVEWILRDEGGGYVATHAIDTPMLKQCRHGGDKNRFLLTPDGHQMVDTSYHYVTLAETAEAAVVGMTSTSLQTSRTWQTLMKQVKVPHNGQLVVAPAFSRVYRLTTVYKKNDQGDWFQWAVQDAGWALPDYADAYREARATFLHIREHGAQMGRPPESTAPEGPSPTSYDGGEEPPI